MNKTKSKTYYQPNYIDYTHINVTGTADFELCAFHMYLNFTKQQGRSLQIKHICENSQINVVVSFVFVTVKVGQI